MSDNNNGSGGVVLMAFVLGAAAGAAMALLYAPAPGEETRQRLRDRAREGKEKADEIARDSREFLNRQRDNVGAAVDRGREAFEAARKETL
ncbi:MAG: YtxH domain-containing protein [Acidobacteria bacterium]|jgi:gas vesicle protein|nr:YtxH domain-containing protein [Acidobacteriota bacterium]